MSRSEFITAVAAKEVGVEERVYFEEGCKLTTLLHNEDKQLCNARMRFHDGLEQA
ncbi:hypothetical protein D3C71_1951620 [compost metagenome]